MAYSRMALAMACFATGRPTSLAFDGPQQLRCGARGTLGDLSVRVTDDWGNLVEGLAAAGGGRGGGKGGKGGDAGSALELTLQTSAIAADGSGNAAKVSVAGSNKAKVSTSARWRVAVVSPGPHYAPRHCSTGEALLKQRNTWPMPRSNPYPLASLPPLPGGTPGDQGLCRVPGRAPGRRAWHLLPAAGGVGLTQGGAEGHQPARGGEHKGCMCGRRVKRALPQFPPAFRTCRFCPFNKLPTT